MPRLKNGSHSPSGLYPIVENTAQAEQLMQSAFVPDDVNPQWMPGMCVDAEAKRVRGKVLLSATVSGADDAGILCMCYECVLVSQMSPCLEMY